MDLPFRGLFTYTSAQLLSGLSSQLFFNFILMLSSSASGTSTLQGWVLFSIFFALSLTIVCLITIYINDYSTCLCLARLLFLLHIARLHNINTQVIWRHCKFNMSTVEFITFLSWTFLSPSPPKKVCFFSEFYNQWMTPIHLGPWQFFHPDFPHPVQLRKPSDSLGSAISSFAATIVTQAAPGLEC